MCAWLFSDRLRCAQNPCSCDEADVDVVHEQRLSEQVVESEAEAAAEQGLRAYRVDGRPRQRKRPEPARADQEIHRARREDINRRSRARPTAGHGPNKARHGAKTKRRLKSKRRESKRWHRQRQLQAEVERQWQWRMGGVDARARTSSEPPSYQQQPVAVAMAQWGVSMPELKWARCRPANNNRQWQWQWRMRGVDA